MTTRKTKSLPPAPLQWTEERPQRPGWYWYRGPGGDADLLIVQVDEAGYLQWPDGGFSEAAHTEGEWAGPLTPPEDPL